MGRAGSPFTNVARGGAPRPLVAVMCVADGKWKETWYYADELGLMLQLGIVNDVLNAMA
jgi:hypothetical protein